MGKKKDRQAGSQAQGRARTSTGMGSLLGTSLVLQVRMAIFEGNPVDEGTTRMGTDTPVLARLPFFQEHLAHLLLNLLGETGLPSCSPPAGREMGRKPGQGGEGRGLSVGAWVA